MSKCVLVHSECCLAQCSVGTCRVTKSLTAISDFFLKKASKMKLEKTLLTSEPSQNNGA